MPRHPQCQLLNLLITCLLSLFKLRVQLGDCCLKGLAALLLDLVDVLLQAIGSRTEVGSKGLLRSGQLLGRVGEALIDGRF